MRTLITMAFGGGLVVAVMLVFFQLTPRDSSAIHLDRITQSVGGQWDRLTFDPRVDQPAPADPPPPPPVVPSVLVHPVEPPTPAAPVDPLPIPEPDPAAPAGDAGQTPSAQAVGYERLNADLLAVADALDRLNRKLNDQIRKPRDGPSDAR